jgi:hypothetical protein
MPSPLDNLSGTGKPLVAEPPDAKEIAGLKFKALAQLKDARNTSLSLESRFDLAYNAAHGLCLAALRMHGFRPQHRYIVFQVLSHTLGIGPETGRVLSKCHDARNLGEYEGDLNISARLVEDLIAAADTVAAKLEALPKPRSANHGPVE